MLPNLENISNNKLVGLISNLKTKESEVISELVLHINEIDKRGYYRDLGYSSLFAYLTQDLKYSEGAAQRRIRAARAINDNPEVYHKLRAGSLTLCTVCEVSKVALEKRSEIFAISENKSKREVEKIVSLSLPPAKVKKESVRISRVSLPVMPLLEFKDSPPPVVVENYTITLQVDKEFMAVLEEAKLLTGAVKNSDAILKALQKLVKAKTPKVRNKVTATRASEKGNDKITRYIPVGTKAAVLIRDARQCSFVSADGKRCGAKEHLELDHIKPYAAGGGNQIDNLRVLCRAHNQLMAERHFGKDKIAGYKRIPR